MSDTPETHIHIESRIDGAVHVSGSVYVNGTPVLLAEDGLGIEYGFNDMTTVTLKILPKTLTFGGPVPSSDGADDARKTEAAA